jgi:hypothetical protein
MDGSVHTFCVQRQPKCCWRAFSRPAILTVLVGEHQPGGYLAAAPRQTDVDKVSDDQDEAASSGDSTRKAATA